MKHKWIVVVPAAALLVWAALPSRRAAASSQIAKDTELACTACHDKPGSKLLTGRGKFYELMGNLDDFEALATEFGDCTSCHVKKPGSMRLTRAGREAKERLGDMTGVCRNAREHRAQPAPTPAPTPADAGAGLG